MLWESCPVTRSPSCGRLHRQTVKPLPPPTCVVSSSTYLFGWTDHGTVTASSGANPQTEAPWPSLPCRRHDGAPSLYHTLRRTLRHCIPVALEMCFTCKQRSFGSLCWPSPTCNRVGRLRRLFLPKVKHNMRAAQLQEVFHPYGTRTWQGVWDRASREHCGCLLICLSPHAESSRSSCRGQKTPTNDTRSLCLEPPSRKKRCPSRGDASPKFWGVAPARVGDGTKTGKSHLLRNGASFRCSCWEAGVVSRAQA